MDSFVYLPGAFTETLRCYIKERELEAPEVLEALAPLSNHQRIPAEFFCALLEQIYQIDPVPALGMRIGKVCKPAHFGVVGHLVASCNNLGQALMRYRRFQTLLLTDLDAKVSQRGGTICFKWKQRMANTPLAYEFSIAAFVNLYQALIGRAIAPLSIGLPYAKPEETPVYEALMNCPVAFGASCLTIEIPARLMAMRISSNDAYLRNIFDKQAQAMLLDQRDHSASSVDEFLQQLQYFLSANIHDGKLSAEKAAQELGYSLRTFYRKLNSHGLSFRAVLADVRLRLAKNYLCDSQLSTSEIALLLGYSEQSAFIRAFRNWTGGTPGEYRKSVLV